MAPEDIDQLTEALAKTHVGEELSYKGQGLKLNDKQSGRNIIVSFTLHLRRVKLLTSTHCIKSVGDFSSGRSGRDSVGD